MRRCCWGFAIMLGLAALTATRAADRPSAIAAPGGWVAKRVFDPFRNESHCVVETARQSIHDGYQDTVVFVRLEAKSLRVVTESSIDLHRGEVGLQVDGQTLIKADRLYLDQSAVFETDIGRIIEQFKSGQGVMFQLYFWPTWPSKGRKIVRFSLSGFSRALASLPGC
jgi:hypothetical protein